MSLIKGGEKNVFLWRGSQDGSVPERVFADGNQQHMEK